MQKPAMQKPPRDVKVLLEIKKAMVCAERRTGRGGGGGGVKCAAWSSRW